MWVEGETLEKEFEAALFQGPPLSKDSCAFSSVLENSWTHQLKAGFELHAHELPGPH